MTAAISTRAGLPSTNPTKSYWLHDPSEVLLGHRTTEDLPEEADIVIVGSGITGAFAARFLFDEEEKHGGGNKSRVVVLEAREAVSGATGRNGGHCQPLVYGAVPEVAEFEIENFEYLKRLVEDEKIDCDWVTLTGVHAFYTEHLLSLAASSVSQLQQTHPSLASTLELISSPSPLLSQYRVPTAVGAVIQKKAASLWPYKLVSHVLASLLSTRTPEEFNLQTNTPATCLSPSPRTSGGWIITTPRGNIHTKKVLLSTNGYTSNLLPSFSDLIVPVRGQVAALTPPTAPPIQLSHSYLFAADPEEGATLTAPRDDYLVQRPLPTGEIIYGGGRRFANKLGVGISSDDEVEPTVAQYLRSELTPVLNLSDGTKNEQLKAKYEWTGIMGYSRDLHAWVGEVPQSLFAAAAGGGGGGGGVYVCAGYTGHGMPAATLSARAVAREMLGVPETQKDDGGVRLPQEFKITEERVVRARGLPLVEGGWEVNTLGTLFSGVLGEDK
ncbi:FAD dependent oxidoreductase-domain-containing protein [Cladorrhinum sp. PSN332]|nr:FAD dependent oxidoreductase-domain-containing protein [Cladorrhinum sp. PSN332]